MDHLLPTLPAPRSVGAARHDPAAGQSGQQPSQQLRTELSDAGVVTVRWRGRQPLVSLSGEVDLATTERLEVIGLLLRQWRSLVIVDAAGVSFLDAAGLRGVLALAGGDACHEATLIVQHPSAAVMRLLELAVVAEAGVRLDPSAVVSRRHPEVPVTGWALTGLPGW